MIKVMRFSWQAACIEHMQLKSIQAMGYLQALLTDSICVAAADSTRTVLLALGYTREDMKT